MQVWNVLHASRWKYRTQKIVKKSLLGYHRTTLSGYIFAAKACIDNRKSVKHQYLRHMFSQYSELRLTNGWDRVRLFGAPQQISTGLASWLRYCSDVAHRKPTKPCTMFDRLYGPVHYIWQGGHHVGRRPTFLVLTWNHNLTATTFNRLQCQLLLVTRLLVAELAVSSTEITIGSVKKTLGK